MMSTLVCRAVALFAALAPRPPARCADVPPGATWTEATIPSADGVQLHADILRPTAKGNARTPVILSIGPYFNHSGQTGPAGPVEGTSYDPVGPSTGPSDRFLDLVEGAHLMERGYTFVMVDLRGFGGSSGCLDWGGPGEQADVVKSVEWAAQQPWSTGAVGMYGKSYDGVTGLVGVNRKPAGAEGGRLPGAGLRPLPLPLRRRHPARQLAPHADAVRRHQRHARAQRSTTRSTTSTARTTTRSVPGAWRATSPTRPATTTILGVLEGAEPDPGRRRARRSPSS